MSHKKELFQKNLTVGLLKDFIKDISNDKDVLLGDWCRIDSNDPKFALVELEYHLVLGKVVS
jgi:hypothetical protein